VPSLNNLQVIRDTVDQPKQLTFKSTTDIVTETDKASEVACISVIRAAFPGHAILVGPAAASMRRGDAARQGATAQPAARRR
jgi:fructose-1,6-bisphosphatase/inositol monophosphatase family enzyme